MGLTLLFSTEPELSGFAARLRRLGIEHLGGLIREAQLHREIRDDVDPVTLAITIGAMQQHVLFEILRTKVGAESVVDIFDHHRLDDISDEELHGIVHQVLDVLRVGAATPDGPRPVEGVQAKTFDIKGAFDRVFAPARTDSSQENS